MDTNRHSVGAKVLRTPTMSPNVFKWTFFVARSGEKASQVDCITVDAHPKSGLFDTLGQIYYTCESSEHKPTFATEPGACTAPGCGETRIAIVTQSSRADMAIQFGSKGSDYAALTATVNLGSLSNGFCLEMWLAPYAHTASACILGQSTATAATSPSLWINSKLQLSLRLQGNDSALWEAAEPLQPDTWQHLALSYEPTSKILHILLDGESFGDCSLASHSPGFLATLGSTVDDTALATFQGQVDELRLWSMYRSDVASIKNVRVTGLESGLLGYWPFNEGSANWCYNAVEGGPHIKLSHHVDNSSWAVSNAPLLSGTGLSRRVLRFAGDCSITTGLTATMYYEQVITKMPKKPSDDKKDSAEKPLKRAGRLLLAFGMTSSGLKSTLDSSNNLSGTRKSYRSDSRLGVLDFGLNLDGGISDFPGLVNLPLVAIENQQVSPSVTSKSITRNCIITDAIYVDSVGMELFGALVDSDKAIIGQDAPYATESATGDVSIYFCGHEGRFTTLAYNVTRTVQAVSTAASLTSLGLLAALKLRNAENLSIETSECSFLPPSVGIDVSIKASLGHGTLTEYWRGEGDALSTCYTTLTPHWKLYLQPCLPILLLYADC